MTIVSRLLNIAPKRERPAKETLEPKALYRTHLGFVWRNLRRLGVPELSAEDAAQDVFIVVHRRWDSYDARWSSVETWLFGIVLRVARNYRRAARRRQGRFDANTDAEEVLQRVATPRSTPDEIAESRQAAALLERMLTQLSDKKRAMLVMVDIEEMSVPEAAQALGVNVNTAYWRLRAARQEFQKALACQKDAPLSGASERVRP
jgi:RNA polymerase sigma-70 factor (ECF subfamily)